MVNINVIVGPKGQIVIPKAFRDEFQISPGSKVVLEDRKSEIVIKKGSLKFLEVFERLSKKGPKVKFGPHDAYEEELMSRP